MKLRYGERIGKKVIGISEEKGEEACAEGGKIRLKEDRNTPFCRNMARAEMEEWVRQRKAHVGEKVAKDIGDVSVVGTIVGFEYTEEGKKGEKDRYKVKYEQVRRKGGRLTMRREPKMKYMNYNEMLNGRDCCAELHGSAQTERES